LPLFLQIVLQQCDGDATKIKKVMAGLRAYQSAARPPRPPARPEIARIGRVRALDYGGQGQPVLFIPSIINPPYVLDLAKENSLLRWLAGQGHRVILLDWGDPREDGHDLSVAGHVEQLLIPLIAQLGHDVVLAGYCLGGTMALSAAQLLQPRGLIMIAAPWNFTGYPDDSREKMGRLWQVEQAVAESLGLFPMEMLQSAFWQLAPEKTLEKYAAFGAMPPDSPAAHAFIALEDWANEGPPLTVAAARELLEDMFEKNAPGEGRWEVAGETIDLLNVRCPVLNVISTTDKIVPAATAPDIGQKLILEQGHVGMIVGRSAATRLWLPTSVWLSRLQHSC